MIEISPNPSALCESDGQQPSNQVFSAAFCSLCLLAGRPHRLSLTIIIFTKRLQYLGLCLRWHPIYRHRLAALVYQLVAGRGQDLQTSLGNYAIDCRRAHAADTPLPVPHVAEFLTDPAFRPLAHWIRQRHATGAEMQTAVNHFLDMPRQAALEQE